MRVHRSLRLVAGTVLFVAAGYLGRATIIDGQGLSLIWPAIGVAGLWIGSGNRRTWPGDVLALSASTLLVTLTTGATPARAAVLLATNLVQVATFVALSRRWLPQTWGLGGTQPLRRTVELGRLVLAASLSGLSGLAVGCLGVVLIHGTMRPPLLAVWWGRNTVALIVITVLGILVGQPLQAAGSVRSAVTRVRVALTPASLRRWAETVALLSVTVALSWLIFSETTGQPLAFLLMVMSVWAGIRYSPVAVTAHGVVMGACGIAFTLNGSGPFASVNSIYYQALVSQAFVAMTLLTGLALAFSRAERDAAITGLHEARRAADDRARLLDAVLESMRDGIVVLDETGAILVSNAAAHEFAQLVDGTREKLQEAAAHGLTHPNGDPVTDSELPGRRALAGEAVEPSDFHLRGAGTAPDLIFEMNARVLVDDDPSQPRRAMVNTREVTLDRQHRDTLAAFAGVIAHDLANPLTVIDGWSEELSAEFTLGPVSPLVGSAMVERIHDATAHMRAFIADLMSYTIARDQTLRPGPVDLSAMVRELAGLRTASTAEPLIVVGSGLQVFADAGLVRQLLDNLIGNAVKYVAPGVRPTVEITGHVEGDWLELRVADNGIGIPENQREAVFENFHRAHGDDFRGTGLGLAICRRIVDRHGGSIAVTPGPHGMGSVFVLQLPRTATASEAGRLPVLAPLGA